MAVCYNCEYKYRGETECPNCGMPAEYNCHECGTYIDPTYEKLCPQCLWYVCPECGACGCSADRPLSREERGDGWDEETLF